MKILFILPDELIYAFAAWAAKTSNIGILDTLIEEGFITQRASKLCQFDKIGLNMHGILTFKAIP